MSDYHILQQDLEKKTINVVLHIPISASGTNAAGLTWREAIVQDLLHQKQSIDPLNITSVLPNISTTELTAIQSGALFEVAETFRFSSINLTPAQKKIEIEARFIALKNTDPLVSLILQKQIILEWIGYSNNVS